MSKVNLAQQTVLKAAKKSWKKQLCGETFSMSLSANFGSLSISKSLALMGENVSYECNQS